MFAMIQRVSLELPSGGRRRTSSSESSRAATCSRKRRCPSPSHSTTAFIGGSGSSLLDCRSSMLTPTSPGWIVPRHAAVGESVIIVPVLAGADVANDRPDGTDAARRGSRPLGIRNRMEIAEQVLLVAALKRLVHQVRELLHGRACHLQALS